MRALPWVGALLAFAFGVFVGRTWLAREDGSGVSAEDHERAIGELHARIETLEARASAENAQLGGGGTSPPATPVVAEGEEEPREPAPPAEPADVRKAKLVAEWELRQRWMKDIRSLRSAEKRAAALEAIAAAFAASDPAVLLAGLKAARALSRDLYDADLFRERILPHVRSEDSDIRWAARTALAEVKPRPEDLWMWLKEVETVDRDTAWEVTDYLTRTAERVIEGQAAEAVLHLLRDGTDLDRGDVVAGLSGAERFDTRVLDRLVEVARAEKGKSNAPHNFFQCVAQSLKPKPDAVVDLALDTIAEGGGDRFVFGSLHWGLTEAQQARAADALMGFAENAGDARSCRKILEGLHPIATRAQLARLEALASDPEVDERIREQAAQLAASVRRR